MTMNPHDISTSDVFAGLFPIHPATLEAVTRHMAAHGYDAAYPVVLWAEGGVLIDGHTRLAAAKAAGLKHIAAVEKSFDSEDAAVEYAIHCQRDRRNLSDADLLRWIAEVDKRKTKSEAGKEGRNLQLGQAQPCASPKKTAEQTAEIVGTSARKVEQARTIIDQADAETKAKVASGELSINKAYNATRKTKTMKTATPRDKTRKTRPNARRISPKAFTPTETPGEGDPIHYVIFKCPKEPELIAMNLLSAIGRELCDDVISNLKTLLETS